MKKILILLITTVFIVSCASNGGNNRMKSVEVSKHSKVVLADNSSDEKVVCKQVRKIGSHRSTTVCQSQSEIEAIRKATQNEIRKTNHQSGSCDSFGNCGN